MDALRRDPPPTVGVLADRLGPAAFGALLVVTERLAPRADRIARLARSNSLGAAAVGTLYGGALLGILAAAT